MGYSSDEFYTQYSDIKAELSLCDKSYFKDKIIYCPFDAWHSDSWPLDSQYIQYFKNMAQEYQYKQLVTTNEGYTNNYYTYTREGDSYVEDSSPCPVEGNEVSGDYWSGFCMELLSECDMVITTPPSSCYSDFLTMLIGRGKPFLVCGSGLIAGGSKFFVDKFANQELFFGRSRQGFDFMLSKEYSRPNKREAFKIINGKKCVSLSYYNWITNIPYNVSYPEPELQTMTANENAGYVYKRYDNFDGIDVGQLRNIPSDYFGVMGVASTFMRVYNPDIWEVLDFVKMGNLFCNGVPIKSHRIIVKRKEGTVAPGSSLSFVKVVPKLEEPVDVPTEDEPVDLPVQLQEPMEHLLSALKELNNSNHGVLLKLDNLRSDTSLDARYIRERVGDIITDMEGLDKKLVLFTEEYIAECKKVSFLLGIINEKLDKVLHRLD